MLRIMKKEVKFLTENSQDKEKALSFKDKILSELAAANGTQNHSAQQEAQPLLDKEMELAESLESLVSAVEKSHEVLEKETSVEEESVKLQVEEAMEQEKLEVDNQADVLENIVRNSTISETPSSVEGLAQTELAKSASAESEEVQSSAVQSRTYQTESVAATSETKDLGLPESSTTDKQQIEKDFSAAEQTLSRRNVGHGKKRSRAARTNGSAKKKRKNGLANRIVMTVLVIVLLGLGVTGFVGYNYVNSALKPMDASSTEYVTVEIPAGSSTKQIGEILEKKGLIKNAQVFNLYSKFRSYGNYQSGYYNLQKSMDLDTIAKQLQEGGTDTPQPPVLGKITIPEGYTLEQLAETVTVNAAATANQNTKTPFSKEEFLNKAQDEDFIAKMLAKYPQLLATLPSKDSGVRYRLEGYLFPATYEYGKETTIEGLIDQMLAAMNTNLSQYYSTLESKNLTVNDVLTLASLVEKEGSTDQDRKDIASVFYNRLNQDMPLQSNIALLYAQGKLGQKTTLKEDAEIDTNLNSPYNVYKKQGLMPGPVDSPSLSAIEATINPSKTEYLYFVANVETGAVYFANTYEEHAKNVEEHVNSKLNQSGESSN